MLGLLIIVVFVYTERLRVAIVILNISVIFVDI